MPTLEENYNFWNHNYHWDRYGGDEWSARWGGPDVQWTWSLLPRLAPLLPTGTLLEVGPGFGRWSEYLKGLSRRLILVDLSEKCIHACKQRLGSEGVEYFVNDGRSLKGVQDRSVDLIFSFESLVHTEAEVMEAYLQEFSRVLKPEGAGFVHHSNLGAYPGYYRVTQMLPSGLKRPLKKTGLLGLNEWRAPSMSADLFRKFAQEAGLSCWVQEQVPWGGRRLIDCFSTFGKEKRPLKVFKNPGLMKRAYHLQRLSDLYGKGVPW